MTDEQDPCGRIGRAIKQHLKPGDKVIEVYRAERASVDELYKLEKKRFACYALLCPFFLLCAPCVCKDFSNQFGAMASSIYVVSEQGIYHINDECFAKFQGKAFGIKELTSGFYFAPWKHVRSCELVGHPRNSNLSVISIKATVQTDSFSTEVNVVDKYRPPLTFKGHFYWVISDPGAVEIMNAERKNNAPAPSIRRVKVIHADDPRCMEQEHSTSLSMISFENGMSSKSSCALNMNTSALSLE